MESFLKHGNELYDATALRDALEDIRRQWEADPDGRRLAEEEFATLRRAESAIESSATPLPILESRRGLQYLTEQELPRWLRAVDDMVSEARAAGDLQSLTLVKVHERLQALGLGTVPAYLVIRTWQAVNGEDAGPGDGATAG